MAPVFILAGSCLLLLLVMSNLLLCQGNVCLSCGPDVFGVPLKFLRKTFSHFSRLSHDMHNLSTRMYNEFDEKYSHSKPEYINATNICHTNSLHAPEESKKAQQMNMSLSPGFFTGSDETNEDLTRWILMFQYLWNSPLYYLIMDQRIKNFISDAILSNAKEYIKKSYKVQTILERRFTQMVLPVRWMLSEDRMYWSGFAAMVSSKEDVCHSTFYKVFKCLSRDSCTVDMYTKILECRISDEW